MKVFQSKKFIAFIIVLIIIMQAFALTVFAENLPTHTVSFDLNGFPGETPESRQISHGGYLFPPPEELTADGYRFIAWYKEPECENVFEFEEDTITEDTTIYAGWEKDTVVDISVSENSIDFGKIKTGFSATDEIRKTITVTNTGDVPVKILLKNPVNDGPFGSVWHDENAQLAPNDTMNLTVRTNPSSAFALTPGVFNGSYEITAVSVEDNPRMVVKNVNARVEICNIYTVSFILESGGTLVPVLDGNKVAKPVDPIKENYIFDGWYRDPQMTQIFNFNTPITSDITLYAKFIKKAYTALSSDGVTIAKNDPKALNYNAVFNPEEYWELNPDVKNDAYFGSSYDNAFIHFLNYGMPEGRVGSNNFNVVKYAYCLLNDDLRSAFGGNMKQYYTHFLRYGQFEGRSKSDWDSIFDADFYLTSNPDVKTYLINKYTSDGNLKGWCLWHYCEFGANEGRLANSEFSVLNYASANPDVFKAYSKYSGNKIITDFKAIAVQYLQFGKKEHRPIVNGKYNMNNLPTLRPDVVSVLGIGNLSGWVDWYINCGSKGM